MANKASKTRRKRLPKSLRIYIRRLKQAARKSGIPYRSPFGMRTNAGQKEDVIQSDPKGISQ